MRHFLRSAALALALRIGALATLLDRVELLAAPALLLAAALSRICPDVLYSLLTVFLASYATKELDFPTSHVLTAVLTGSAVQIVVMPLAGSLTDRFNRRLVYGIGAVLTGAAATATTILDALPPSSTPRQEHR